MLPVKCIARLKRNMKSGTKKMITLLTYPPAFGLQTSTPFGLKAIMLLNMSGEPWRIEYLADPRRMPHKKLPVIRVDDKIIHDSENIRLFLEERGADFDKGLNAREKAFSLALIRMADEHMYFHALMDRWGSDDVWPAVRAEIFASVPRPIRNLVANGLRRKTLSGMNVHGIGRANPEERLSKLEHDLKAIGALVSEGFLFGETPSAADASVAAMLCNMAANPIETPLARRVKDDPVLTAYSERMATAALQTAAS